MIGGNKIIRGKVTTTRNIHKNVSNAKTTGSITKKYMKEKI